MRFSLRDVLSSAADIIGGSVEDTNADNGNGNGNGNGQDKNDGADSVADSTSTTAAATTAAGGLLSVSNWELFI